LKPAGYPAGWLASRHALPVGVFLYGTELLLLDQKTGASAFKRMTARWLCDDVSVFVAISQWTADLARSLFERLDFAAAARRIRVVHLGTDPTHFHPGVDTSAVSERYGLRDGRWLLTVARLEWHKGIDTMIRALPAIRAAHPDARYAVAGVGDRRPQLERLVAELGLGAAVRFLGAVPDEDLPGVYNAATLYVGPSRRHEGLAEGFGLSLVEASACGLAVVGGRSGGVPDAVRDGETGVLVDPDDPAAVAAAVNALLDDSERRAQLGAAGRRAVETYYNWDRVVRDVRGVETEFTRPLHLRRPPRPSATARPVGH
jgi:phosphatidylinositol alpha-1,6-mannosyltransferase